MSPQTFHSGFQELASCLAALEYGNFNCQNKSCTFAEIFNCINCGRGIFHLFSCLHWTVGISVACYVMIPETVSFVTMCHMWTKAVRAMCQCKVKIENLEVQLPTDLT